MSKNIYFPCLLVEHENYYSIITSNFHYFDDYFKEKEAGGYSVDKLAKKLAKNNSLKNIDFDSEAGMFCAYSENKEQLLKLCKLLKEITGKEDLYITKENPKPLLPIDEAEKLLLKGFVLGIDKEAQKTFLENIPMPTLSKKQSEYINAIKAGPDDEKVFAAKKINSEARTNTRNWDNYLSHPNTVSIFLNAIDKENNPKVYQELIWALVFICSRHLPDLRTKPYFLKALENKNATIRWLGVMGLGEIFEFSEECYLKLKEDRSKKVRDEALRSLSSGTKKEYPSWIFDKNNFA